MYKHQVIGVRRERSWRSRNSEHIVGVCTLEALDGDGQFHDFAPLQEWNALGGQVEMFGAVQPHLDARCRYWSLEEVIRALQMTTPQGVPMHEFTTWDRATGSRAKVFRYTSQGRAWISTGGSVPATHLHAQRSHPELVVCDVLNRCPVVPTEAQPISRGHAPDC